MSKNEIKQPPDPPFLRARFAGGGAVKLSWEHAPETDPMRYEIQWRRGVTSAWRPLLLPNGGYAFDFVHKNLDPGKSYFYRSKSVFFGAVESDWSIQVRVDIPGATDKGGLLKRMRSVVGLK